MLTLTASAEIDSSETNQLLLSMAERQIQAESKAALPSKSQQSDIPAATAKGLKTLRKRLSLKGDIAQIRLTSGSELTEVQTKVIANSLELHRDQATLQVKESTSYTSSGSPDYSYSEDHVVKFIRQNGQWLIDDLTTSSPMSPVSKHKVADLTPEAERRSEKLKTSRAAAGQTRVQLNKTKLFRGDELKQQGVSPVDGVVTTPRSDGSPAPKASTVNGGLILPAAAQTTASTAVDNAVELKNNGSGPPYDYGEMVRWARQYATSPVAYSRDTNDCTTFTSWALWRGGWAEDGNESNWVFNRKSDKVWYWRCSSCKPKHSYTWGGAQNWQNFAYNKGRVKALSNVYDALSADIIQFDVKGYGGDGTADHSMIVTGRKPDGTPTLSYHSTDTLDRPLNEILADNPNTTWWAFRT